MRKLGFETFGEVVAIANAESLKSNDIHTKVGAVLLCQNRLGEYVVSSRGHNHIVDNGDPDSFERPLKYSRSVHAEVMAIGDAAKHGALTFRAILYTTHTPCAECAKLIRSAGISAVVVGPGEYASNSPENMAAAEHMLRDCVTVIPLSEIHMFDL